MVDVGYDRLKRSMSMATHDRHPPEVSNFVVCPLPVGVDWELGIRVDPGVSLVVRIVVREVG
jgi:hypothetical protein